MRFGIAILFLLISSLHLLSSDMKFYNINSIYGISMRETSSICKDDNGFIWTSSKTGILRVTDGDYRIYSLPYRTADVITVKLIYKNSQLYAYTNNGQLFVYDELHDNFGLIVDLRELLTEHYLHLVLSDMTIDESGKYWFATSAGLYRYDTETLTLINEKHIDVTRITKYDDTHLIFATSEGISMLDVNILNTEFLYRDIENNMSYTSCLYYDNKNNRLWLGSNSEGLYYYDFKDRLFEKITLKGFPKQPIMAIRENSDSTLYIGIDGQGIWEISKDGKSLLNIYKEHADRPHSLSGDGVYDIFCDEDKKVWVSTYSGGLSFFEKEAPLVNQLTHQINNPNSLCNNQVNKVLEDSRGNIWFATNNGVCRWKVSTGKWDVFYQNKHEQAQVFLALCEDNEGNIWAGTYSSGVYILDSNTGKELKHYSFDGKNDIGFSGKFIFDIFKDSEGDIWLGGMLSDIICYKTKEKQLRSYSSQPVRSFSEYSPGKILASCTYGLLLLDKESGEEEIILNNYLTQGALEIDDNLWISTSGDGLVQFNKNSKTATKFTGESGLSSNYVNSVISANGYLWLGTESGLCRFSPHDNSVLVYSFILPLSNISYNVNAGLKLKNGNLAWGTNEGVVIFDPNRLYKTSHQGEIFFQDITISGRSIRETPKLLHGIPVNKQTDVKLNYNQSTFALELIPIGVSSLGTKFSWKLEGIDNDWSPPSDLRFINYANIPSGNFELKIRMLDNSLSQIIDERMLSIQIVPPYWDTWWFRLIVFTIIGIITFFILKIYTNRLKQRHAEDKIRFFTNTAHDIRTSLTLIKAPIEELNKEKSLSDKGQYYLNLATEQSNRLSFVTTQLLDFQKVDIGKGQVFLIMVNIVELVSRRISMFEATAKKDNINLVFSSDKDVYITAVDELKFEKVVDNLISNAIKYSHPHSNVEINLTCKREEWILAVRDYGLGISDNAQNKLFREFYRGDNVANSKMVGSGIGLLLVKSYVSMHNGEIILKSKVNEGSTFTIRVPYKEVAETASPQATKTDIKTNIPIEADHNTEGSEISIKEEEELTPKKQTILIVEDNGDLQNFLNYSLQDLYNITIANDGLEAWQIIQKKMPDLVISDIMMPEMDGLELCRLIKSTFETSHTPVILLTSLSEKTKQLEGLGLGADDYITKPFDIMILTHRIKSIVKNREAVRDKAVKMIKQNDNELIFTNELNDRFVKKAVEVINNNISNSLFGKDEFASAMNVSSSLLYKKIKGLTGQSPTDFIKIIRLNYSLELLQSRKYTITEVSELTGFSSIGYFSTVFKKHFGKSPTEILN
ncbi:MAG: two-component regulator propeller domain-containing protein [Dysgonomonas sp.]|nr:two-component regulator propeller domain-containing protein [Dysgonomonas sp.]